MWNSVFEGSLAILLGRIISKPIIMTGAGDQRILKFLFKIPNNRWASCIINPGSFQTIPVFFYGETAEKYLDYADLGKDLILNGRLVNVRARRKLFSDTSIDLMIKTFLEKESSFLNASPQKREQIRERILTKLPEKIYSSRFRYEICAFQMERIKHVNNYRNYIEISGEFEKEKIWEKGKNLFFNLKYLRSKELVKRGLIGDRSGFDIIRVSGRNQAENKIFQETESSLLKIIGRIHLKKKFRLEYNRENFENILNSFKKLDCTSTDNFKKLMKNIRKLQRENIETFETEILADEIIAII